MEKNTIISKYFKSEFPKTFYMQHKQDDIKVQKVFTSNLVDDILTTYLESLYICRKKKKITRYNHREF